MLFRFLFAAAAFDIPLDALIDQNLSELILRSFHVELSMSPEGIFEGLIVIIKIEIKLSE